MQEPHAFHALFALHKVVRVAYIHPQQSNGNSGASTSTCSLLLPERARLANDTPPPSRWSAKMTLTGPPPPVSVIFCPPPPLTALCFGLRHDLPGCNARWDLRQTHKKSSINNGLNRLVCTERMGALPHYVFNDFALQHIFGSTNSKGPTDGSKPPKR
jgi:hypothetical protein